MNIKYRQLKFQSVRRVGLYAFVFTSKVSTLAILLLFSSFLIQPFHKALANEASALAQETEEPIVAEEVRQQSEPEAVSTEESPADELSLEESPPEEPPPEEPPPEVSDPDESPPEESPPDETDSSQTEIETSNDEFGDIVVSDNQDLTNGVENTEDLNTNVIEGDNGTEDDESEDDENIVAIENISSTTIGEVVVREQYAVSDENYYQFSKQSCVTVGGGAYHCSASTTNDFDTQSVVYAEKGESGNMEIFLRTTKGKIKQITDNIYDDTSPHFDAESMKIVWQSLIDGRYQIVLYDIDEDQEQQLTFSRTNNMEPKVSEAGIVWQAWDDNDWEIMYFDGKYTDQLTDNLAQDVTPVIEDDYVLWSVLGASEQEAKVYSLDSKETLTITGHEGGSIVNPRFVLVYDTRFENGDVVTQGFDPATGLSAPIAATPATVPINIPESDPIGEIRALINNKSSQKEDTGPDGVKVDQGDGNVLGIISTSTISDNNELNLKQPTFDGVPLIATPLQEAFELTEYDLVIAPQTVPTEDGTNSTTIMVSSASSTQP